MWIQDNHPLGNLGDHQEAASQVDLVEQAKEGGETTFPASLDVAGNGCKSFFSK